MQMRIRLFGYNLGSKQRPWMAAESAAVRRAVDCGGVISLSSISAVILLMPNLPETRAVRLKSIIIHISPTCSRNSAKNFTHIRWRDEGASETRHGGIDRKYPAATHTSFDALIYRIARLVFPPCEAIYSKTHKLARQQEKLPWFHSRYATQFL